MFLIAGLCFCAWTDQKWGRVSNEALMLLAFVGVRSGAGDLLPGRCHSAVWYVTVPLSGYGGRGRQADGSDWRISGNSERVLCGGPWVSGGRCLESVEAQTAWSGGGTLLLSAGVCPGSDAGKVFAAI